MPGPDPDFGRGGHTEPTYERSYDPAVFLGATVAADGSIVATRHDDHNGSSAIDFDRYLADGHLDPSFRSKSTEVRAEATDATGRVIRATQPAYEDPRSIERLNPDGSLDTGFGCEGQTDACQSIVKGFAIEAILPLASGKIVVAGGGEGPRDGEEETREVSLARYDESGVLDPTFGTGGVVHLTAGTGVKSEELISLTVGPGDDVLAAVDDEARTEREPGPRGGSKVVAVGADGHLDSSFGAGGVFASTDYIGAAEGLPGGGLLLTGERWGASLGRYLPPESDIYLTRLSATGAPDPGFSEGHGSTAVDVGPLDSASTLLRRPDGSVVVGGAAITPRFECLARYSFSFFCEETPAVVDFTADGTLDRSFGRDGVERLDPVTFDLATALPVGVLFLRELPDGRILAGGGNAGSAFLADLTSAGMPDPGFGDGGFVTFTHRPRSVASTQSIATDGRHRIIALGLTDAGGIGDPVPAVFRFDHDGSVDRSFGVGRGFVTVPGRDVGTIALAVDRRGRALVLDGKYDANSVTRVTADGGLDPGFGEEGLAPLPKYVWGTVHGHRRRLDITPRAIWPLPDGGVLVSGVSGNNLYSRDDLIRLTPQGALDRSFGHDGVAQIALGRDGSRNARALAVTGDGRIVLAGSIRAGRHERQTAALIRLLPDGRPDPSFGEGGLVTMPIRGQGVFTALAVGPDGAVTVGGRRVFRKHESGLVARYSAAGRPDRPFIHHAERTSGTVAEVGVSPARVLLWGNRVAVVPGRIMEVAGYSPSVLLYAADGSFERELVFGKARRPSTYLDGATLQGENLVVASETAGRRTFRLTRLLP